MPCKPITLMCIIESTRPSDLDERTGRRTHPPTRTARYYAPWSVWLGMGRYDISGCTHHRRRSQRTGKCRRPTHILPRCAAIPAYTTQQSGTPRHHTRHLHACTHPQWHSNPPEYFRIGDTLDMLGNEGLAAYLDILPAEQAFRIPAVMAVLIERRRTTPRGSYWEEDPATALLHTRNSVNALILQAFIKVSVNPDMQRALINYLASTRGIGGWGDAMSNARMWHMRDTVFAPSTGISRVVYNSPLTACSKIKRCGRHVCSPKTPSYRVMHRYWWV